MKIGLPLARQRFFCGAGGFVDDEHAFQIAVKCGQRAYECGLQLVPLLLNNLLHVRDGGPLRRELCRHVARYVKRRHHIGRALAERLRDDFKMRRGLKSRIYNQVSYDLEGEVAVTLSNAGIPDFLQEHFRRNSETVHDHWQTTTA